MRIQCSDCCCSAVQSYGEADLEEGGAGLVWEQHVLAFKFTRYNRTTVVCFDAPLLRLCAGLCAAGLITTFSGAEGGAATAVQHALLIVCDGALSLVGFGWLG